MRNLFDDPPALPNKHDSVDYLRDADDRRYSYAGEELRDDEFMAPQSSSASYVYSEVDAHVESANRVKTGTAALAAILANMDRGEGRGERNPFESGEQYRSRGSRF